MSFSKHDPNIHLAKYFIKKLSTPFVEWPQHSKGIINDKGEILKKDDKDHTNFTYYDLLILNIKRLLEKNPLEKQKIKTYAGALYLLKEGQAAFDKSEIYVIEKIEENIQDLLLYEEYIVETESAVPVNAAGGGNVAGIGVGPEGEPGGTKNVMSYIRRKNVQNSIKARAIWNEKLKETNVQ